mgnify:CR=1 FL=1
MIRYKAILEIGLNNQEPIIIYLYAYSMDHVTHILKDYFIVNIDKVAQ